MKRRSFVKASLVGGTATALMPMASSAESKSSLKKMSSQIYELRVYSFKDNTQEKLTADYFEHAAIPVLNRINIKPVGVFRELKPEGISKLYVLMPFNSLDDFFMLNHKMDTDAAYLKAADAYLNAPATAPAYDRIESSLLTAFAHMPRLVTPAQKPRIFELRRYESAGEAAGKKKIEMFNDAGEIEIFKRVGLTPVFFGETIVGGLRPNLTYMLTYDDMAAHDAGWKKFGSDPKWKEIKSIPEYADAKIVSRITSVFLEPASYSQI